MFNIHLIITSSRGNASGDANEDEFNSKITGD